MQKGILELLREGDYDKANEITRYKAKQHYLDHIQLLSYEDKLRIIDDSGDYTWRKLEDLLPGDIYSNHLYLMYLSSLTVLQIELVWLLNPRNYFDNHTVSQN